MCGTTASPAEQGLAHRAPYAHNSDNHVSMSGLRTAERRSHCATSRQFHTAHNLGLRPRRCLQERVCVRSLSLSLSLSLSPLSLGLRRGSLDKQLQLMAACGLASPFACGPHEHHSPIATVFGLQRTISSELGGAPAEPTTGCTCCPMGTATCAPVGSEPPIMSCAARPATGPPTGTPSTTR